MAAFGLLLGGLMITGSLAAFASPGKGVSAAETPASAQDVADGRALFLANCATCHGPNAGGAADGPSLYGVGAAAVDFQVSTGRMPARQQGAQIPRGQPQFGPDDVRKLAAYVASLAPGPGVPTAEQLDYKNLSDEQIAEGGAIFRTNCAMCHNAAGAGGALTQGKYAPSLTGVEPVHIYEAMITGPQSMPVFADSTLTPENKKAIIGYLQAIQENPDVGGAPLGKLGPVTEGLAAWVLGIGLLVGVAVWLGAKAK